MKDLPYFLALIKKNLILWTIIATGGFSKVDFGNAQYTIQNPHFLIMKNYSLSKDDEFKEIWILTDGLKTSITFMGADPKYQKNLKYYFGTDDISGTISGSYSIDNKKVISSMRMIGPLKLGLDTTASVALRPSEISIQYYSKEYRIRQNKLLDSLRTVDSLKH